MARVRAAEHPRREYLAWKVETRVAAPEQPNPVDVATDYLAMGAREAALDWLERAVGEHAHDLVFIPRHPGFG